MNNPITTTTVSSKKGRPEGGAFFEIKAAKLVLADGTSFDGLCPAWQSDSAIGEVVFNTGMTGYVETLTDPSYSGQILNFTYPLIGNYGVPTPDTWESKAIHMRGVIMSELSLAPSHHTSTTSLLEWLRDQKIPVMWGVDTRTLTKLLRMHGTINGIITSTGANVPAATPQALVKVSVPEPKIYNPGKSKTIIAVDCGMKTNILRNLLEMDYTVKRVPHNYDYSAEDFDGVLISNGPGDPTDYPETVEVLTKAMERGVPIFGICLGIQMLGLAAGAKTYKLPYGHRGHNQPAVMPNGRAYITSQNHGFAIDEKTLPQDWEVTFRNLNDGSVEGIAHKAKPFSAVQFHPEAAPGPTDTNFLFENFRKAL